MEDLFLLGEDMPVSQMNNSFCAVLFCSKECLHYLISLEVVERCGKKEISVPLLLCHDKGHQEPLIFQLSQNFLFFLLKLRERCSDKTPSGFVLRNSFAAEMAMTEMFWQCDYVQILVSSTGRLFLPTWNIEINVIQLNFL